MRHEPLDIDPDIRTARTLPGWFYRSEQVHAWLEQRLLARSWQPITHLSRIEPLDEGVAPAAWPFVFLPGSVDEPLLLTRDEHGGVHCLSNVCTHRGATLVGEPCKRAELRCPYHGRRFALDGRMLEMPGFEDAVDFPSPSDDLPQLPLVGFGNFLFTAIDPAWPFAELVELLVEHAGHLPWADAAIEPAGTAVYELEAHWLLYCDNYLEGLHIAHVHPTLAESLTGLETRLGPWGSVQIARPRAGEPSIPAPPEAPADHLGAAALYFFLFPNTMFNVYPWGMSLNVVEPLAVDRTRIRYEAWVWSPELYDTGAGSRLDQLEREDQASVRRMQRGVGSRLYDRGRYSPRHELALHQFHRMLARGWNRSATEEG
ncbi:MAG: SRPBCC family protein [Enhygromyxa sp.]